MRTASYTIIGNDDDITGIVVVVGQGCGDMNVSVNLGACTIYARDLDTMRKLGDAILAGCDDLEG